MVPFPNIMLSKSVEQIGYTHILERSKHTVQLYTVPGTRLWRLRAARAAWGAPAGGSAGVAGAHKFTEGDYFLFPFRRVSRLRRPFVLRPRRRAGRADQPPSARAASQE